MVDDLLNVSTLQIPNAGGPVLASSYKSSAWALADRKYESLVSVVFANQCSVFSPALDGFIVRAAQKSSRSEWREFSNNMSMGLLDLSLTLPARGVPEFNSLVLGASHDQPSAQTAPGHGVGMSLEFMHYALGFEIPKSRSPVPAARDHHPEQRVLLDEADGSFMAFFEAGYRVALPIDRIGSRILAGRQKPGVVSWLSSGRHIIHISLMERHIFVELVDRALPFVELAGAVERSGEIDRIRREIRD